jgi:hypothetical protein
MQRAVQLLALTILLSGCRPTYEDWSRENHAVFQGYMTGDVHTAKAALLEEEKLVARHSARRNPGVDFQAVRTVLYTELCGISQHMGQTNEAKAYFHKYLENSPKKDMTFDGLLAAAKKGDELLKPKWREQK